MTILLAVLIMIDFMFLDDSHFIFDPSIQVRAGADARVAHIHFFLTPPRYLPLFFYSSFFRPRRTTCVARHHDHKLPTTWRPPPNAALLLVSLTTSWAASADGARPGRAATSHAVDCESISRGLGLCIRQTLAATHAGLYTLFESVDCG